MFKEMVKIGKFGESTVMPHQLSHAMPSIPEEVASDIPEGDVACDSPPEGGLEKGACEVAGDENAANCDDLDAPMSVADVVCEDCAQLSDESGLQAQPAPRIIDAEIAYILNSMLRSVIEEGSGNRVQRELGRSDLMGKTGTTNGPQELWFSGFNRDIATTVFVGFDTPEPLGEREQGATVAIPIWIDYMREALKNMPENTMDRPDGIVDRLIDRTTGKLAIPGDPNTVFEYFRRENAPGMGDQSLPGTETDDNGNEELSTETIF